jgi:hypothetical protein
MQGGSILCSGDIYANYSDQRLKKNIVKISEPLKKINLISGVVYNSNDLAAEFGYSDKKQQVGVLAHEIQAVMPQAVAPAPFDTEFLEGGEKISKSGENYLTVQYEKLVPLLIEAIKELSAKVERLEARLDTKDGE